METKSKDRVGNGAYSALLVLGLFALVALGLLGLPVTTVVLALFGVVALGAVVFALWDLAAVRWSRRPAARALGPVRPPSL